jgi:hypothetical protein
MNGSTQVSVVALSWLAMWAWLYVIPNGADRAGSAAAADNDNSVAIELKEYTDLPNPFETIYTDEVASDPDPTPKPQPAPAKTADERAAANKLKADYHKPESIALAAELDRVNREIDKLKEVPKVAPLPIITAKAVKTAPKPNATHEQAELAAAQTKLTKAQQRYQLAQAGLATTPIPEMEAAIAADNRADRLGGALRVRQADLGMRLVDLDKTTGERILAPIVAAPILPAVAQQSKKIQTEFANAQRELETAQAGLTAVIEKHQQARLAWQTAELDRQDRSHRAELDRLKQTEFANLQSHDRQYQLAQLNLKKIQLESQIKDLAVAATPFDGTVQQVKMVAKEGNMVRYEVGIMYAQATVQPRSEAIAFPRWQEDRGGQ